MGIMKKNLLIATQKFIKFYKFSKNKGLKEKSKIAVFSSVTALKLLDNKSFGFVAAFSDGSVKKYEGEQETTNEVIVKQRSKDVVSKLLVKNDDLFYTTFSRKAGQIILNK